MPWIRLGYYEECDSNINLFVRPNNKVSFSMSDCGY